MKDAQTVIDEFAAARKAVFRLQRLKTDLQIALNKATRELNKAEIELDTALQAYKDLETVAYREKI